MKIQVLIFPFLLLLNISAHALATTTQNLSVVIPLVSQITVSGPPSTLTVTLNADGTAQAIDSKTTYTVSSNATTKDYLKITGALAAGGDMPKNTTLSIRLHSDNGLSLGNQILSTQPTDLVIKIPKLITETSSITYIFNVTNGWSIPAQTLSRVVILTLTSAG